MTEMKTKFYNSIRLSLKPAPGIALGLLTLTCNAFASPQKNDAFGKTNAMPANQTRMLTNAQTAPAFGAKAAADAGGDEKAFRILVVKHVYAGGIAALFKESGIIPTGPFVSPGYANGGNNQNGGFGGNNGGFGGGNFGGGFGGIGGNGGFGGGGFGGIGGGFNRGGFGGGFGGF